MSRPPASADLAARLDAALPQTQCTRCGFPDCRRYAEAIAVGQAGIDQCPPGGAEGIARLAAITGLPPVPLNPQHGIEGPRRVAVIDEAWCIGCTLCIKACPVDCIIGAAKTMHTVIEPQCTGCELCVPACPVDCIAMLATDDQRTGRQAWSDAQAEQARAAYHERNRRLAREAVEHEERLQAQARAKLADLDGLTHGADDPDARQRKRAVIEAALARARDRASGPGG